MNLNKLLERQVKKFMPAGINDDGSLRSFLSAVSESYDAYERDHDLSDRAFKISEEEYIRVNNALKTENELKKISIGKIRETIKTIGDDDTSQKSDDLLDVIRYLKRQVIKRKRAERDSSTITNQLTSLIINMQEGILVEDNKRNIALTNPFFCNMFGLAITPDLLAGTSRLDLADQTKHFFKEPGKFLENIRSAVSKNKPIINEELELADGRFFERDFIPIYSDQEYKGHLWKYRDVTERKKAVKALEQSELTNRLIMNGALDAIIAMNMDGQITFWNPQAEKIFGWSETEATGKKLSSLIVPDQYRESHEKGMQRYKESAESNVLGRQIEISALHKNGTEFPIELSIIPVKQNETVFFCSFIRDISERKKAEAKLKATEELWQFALEGAGDGVWEYNFRTKESFFSPQYKRMLGYSDAEFKNDPEEWQKRIHPEDTGIIGEVDQQYFDKKISSHQVEYRVMHKDGKYRWILDRGMAVSFDADGNPLRVIGTHTDITERKENEQELKRLSLVASANKNGVVFTDTLGNITWCNEGFCTKTGFSEAEVIGKTPVELLHGERTNPETLQKMIDLFFTGKNFDVELICYRKDGSHFWGRAKGQSVLNKKGEVLQYFAIVEDISAEKETQLKLAEFEQRFRTALEKIGDNVWEHDMRTGETYFSNITSEISGYLTGNPQENADIWWDQTHPEDRRMLITNDILYRSGKIDHHSIEYRIIGKDGNERWVLDRGVVIEKNAEGKPLKIVGTHTNITERKKTEQLLKLNEEKYRSIIANMNLGLLEVDNEEIVQYANQSFCNMSGFEPDELIGKKASLLFTRGENSEMVETKNELRKKGISDVYEIAMKNKRGELRWWLISGAPRYDDKGNLVGSIGIHLDITEQKELELELLEAREAAEQSAKTKELFLANMSHEIRTPMNAILGMSKQLTKTTLNSTQHFYLDTINKAADHLLVVINDILDISKVEAGKLSLENIGFKPEDVIKHCMTVMSHRAEEKGLRLIKEGTSDTCPVFIGDPHRLTQVLLNLISNAVKFTDKGYVMVACKLLPENNGRQTFVVSVTDTGIGMDEGFQKNLFQKFTQEEKTTARKYGGTGLGMSISKQLVELMGGVIEVKSKKGIGTTITMSVPFTLGTLSDIPKEDRTEINTEILKNKKILLVEDNEMNRLVATTVLAPTGVIITEAENGEEAVSLLQAHHFDLVLMDVQMPVMDGLEATAIIREHINKEIPVIALTANAIKGESERCKQAGMNDFLSKPFEEEDLIQILCHWLSGNGGESNNTSMTTTDTKKAAEKLYDLSSLSRISQGNNAFIKKMVGLFSQQVPQSVQEMKDALEKKEFEKLRSIAHKIKPAIDNMGISSLHKVIRDIEKNAAESPDIFFLSDHVATTEKVITAVTEQLHHETVPEI
ncbi:MAG: PAS domain S-box protein [Ferruginibacter sp.]